MPAVRFRLGQWDEPDGAYSILRHVQAALP
jgi:hypothetical protein